MIKALAFSLGCVLTLPLVFLEIKAGIINYNTTVFDLVLIAIANGLVSSFAAGSILKRFMK